MNLKALKNWKWIKNSCPKNILPTMSTGNGTKIKADFIICQRTPQNLLLGTNFNEVVVMYLTL